MIRFSTVTKVFGGPKPALEDVSFEVAKGEFVFLTGQSGSGKSTLLKIITKEYIPTSGEVEFDSVPLSKLRGSKVHHHRRKIGVVFQDYRLLPELNIWENIALPLEIMNRPKHEIEERVTDLLELVQLVDKAHDFPSQISGGESQRVGIARALATAPSVILADEPTGNLDPQTTMMIAKLFNKIHELGTTIFFATHDNSILSNFPHRRLHLDKGHLVSDTPLSTGAPASVTVSVVTQTEPSAASAHPSVTQTQEHPPVAPESSQTEATPTHHGKVTPEAESLSSSEVSPGSESPAAHSKAAEQTEADTADHSEDTSEATSTANDELEDATEQTEDEAPADDSTELASAPNKKTRFSLPKLGLPFSLGKKRTQPVSNQESAEFTELVIQVESLETDEEVPTE